jgi:hypothetical protein
MKLGKWILFGGWIIALALQPNWLLADGKDDPPHGMPGVGGETVRISSLGAGSGIGMVAAQSRMERANDSESIDPLVGLWADVVELLGGIR